MKFYIMLAFFGLSASTANAQTSGMCGDSLTWTLTGTKPDFALTISGTGDMYNYRDNAPWRSQRSNIKSLVLHDGMTSIGDNAFVLCKGVTSVTIPNSVKTIGRAAFLFCNGLTSITIPNSVVAIGMDAFAECSLTSVTIPSSVKTIGRYAFIMNRNITDIFVSWTTSPPETSIFDIVVTYKSKRVTLHIPQGTLDVYRSARRWKNFINMVEDVTNAE